MRAAGVDYKSAIGSLGDPDAILLLPFRIDAKCIITWWPNAKGARRLKDCSR